MKKIIFTLIAVITLVGCNYSDNNTETFSQQDVSSSNNKTDSDRISVSYALIPENKTIESPSIDESVSTDIVLEDTTLPILYINTDSGEYIASRYEYEGAHLILDNSCGMYVTNGSNHVEAYDGNYTEGEYANPYDDAYKGSWSFDIDIRGRGNASWSMYNQKGLMIKFHDKTSILGMTPAKKYTLISSIGDYALIRNCVAMDLASGLDGLEYTTAQIPVDVFINGKYEGIYTLSEKIEVASDKVNLFSSTDYETVSGDNITPPFLLETSRYVQDHYKYNQDYFYAGHSPQLFINYPKLEEANTEEFTAISAFMRRADFGITHGNSYRDFIDMDSWIDWMFVMELTVNTDSALNRSTFLYKKPDSKLYIGPVWDFDKSFGNSAYDNRSYANWAMGEAVFEPLVNNYYTYLHNNNSFMMAARERWDLVKKELLYRALTAVDKYNNAIAASRPYHNARWNTHASEYGATAIKNFINKRYKWIDYSIHAGNFNRQPIGEIIYLSEFMHKDEPEDTVSANSISSNSVSANTKSVEVK